MQPFETGLLHPFRRPCDGAAVEIERRSDADQCGAVDLAHMVARPEFLVGRTEPNPHDLRARFIDSVDDGGILFFGKAAKWRRIETRYDEIGILHLEITDHRLSNARLATLKIMAKTAALSVVTQSVHEIRAP